MNTSQATQDDLATPQGTQDSQFFWDGVKRGELLIQRCASCKALRHPPRPMCPECRSVEWDTVVASGRGTVWSFVVHHYPPVRGFDPPHVVATIELEEGTRIISTVPDIGPEKVEVGMPVQVSFEVLYDNVILPVFRATTGG